MRTAPTSLWVLISVSVALGCDAAPPADGGLDRDGGSRDGGSADATTPADAGADDAGGDRDAGSDAGPSCPDDGADAMDGARDLGMINDRSTFPAGTEDVTVFPVTDLDWFTYHVEDVVLADVQPRAELRGLPGGSRFELCMYVACDTTTNSVSCELGTAHELSAELRGCCVVGTEAELAVKAAPSCSGTDESSQVYVRVGQQGGAATCTPYTLAWGDD